MQDIISNYIRVTFSEEYVDVVYRTFEILNDFGLSEDVQEDDLVNLLMQESLIARTEMADEFNRILNSKVDQIFQDHTIKLSTTATLAQKNEILSALYLVQNLDNYSEILDIIESDTTYEEIFAEIVSRLSVLTVSDIFVLVEDVTESFSERLKEFIFEKQQDSLSDIMSKDRLMDDMLKRLKFFEEFTEKKPTAGPLMVRSGVLLGQPFKSYLAYTKDLVSERSMDAIALDIFSVLLISSDGFVTPLITFKKFSDFLFQDLNQISKAEVALNKVMMEFDTFTASVLKEKEV